MTGIQDEIYFKCTKQKFTCLNEKDNKYNIVVMIVTKPNNSLSNNTYVF